MDVAHNGASMNEEDRISNLPDEIILRILSFLDMKYAIQTSTLSKKWKHVWTSMSYLNLYNQTFSTIPQFSEFVKKALSHRNHHIEVSALSTEGLNSLEKVNLYMPRSTHIQKIYVPQLLNLFQKLHSAKFLILDPYIIQTLSLGLDQLLCEPCPFISLKCLKISTPKKDRIAEISAEIKKYLLESSPSATFIMDIPQVPQKRSRQEADKDTMAKKVAKLEEEKQTMAEEKRTLEEEKQTMAEEKRTLEEEKHTMAEEKRMLEAKIKMQDGVIAEQKAMMLQQEKLTSRMINCKMAELQVQVAGGDPGYELIRLIKSIMDLTLESSRVAMEAQVSSLYEEMKSLFFTSIDVGEWAKIEMELGITERNRSNNNVPAAAAALQLVSSPSLADVVTSSSIGNAWSG